MAASTDSVVLINPFEVPQGADEGFIADWEAARDFLAAQDGYRSTALHRSLGGDAEFRFINVAEWASLGRFRWPLATPTSAGGSCRSPLTPGCTGSCARTRRRPRTRVGWC
jgi:antibiotic biosynthesis monooxygenase